jgi:hypothetical protein
MSLTSTIYKRLLKRKIATVVLISASLAAFATLGDGGRKEHSGTSSAMSFSSRNFSLRSGYNYKSNNILNNAAGTGKFIMLNTTITFQKGNATYILPLKRKVLLDKIRINPVPPKF